MHPALTRLLLDLRAVSHARKVAYLALLHESLAIHGTLATPWRGQLITLDAAAWRRFLTRAAR